MDTSKQTRTKKEEYIDKMAEQLKEWSSLIDELEARTGQAATDVKAGYAQRMDELKMKRDILAGKIQDLRESSGDAWDTFKAGADISWKDLKDAVVAAKERFKGKKAA